MTEPPFKFDHYRDTGCWVHPACLSCPLPRCIEDEDEPTLAALRRDARNQDMIQAVESSTLPAAALAQHFGVSKRTIHRVLQQKRAERRAEGRQNIGHTTGVAEM